MEWWKKTKNRILGITTGLLCALCGIILWSHSQSVLQAAPSASDNKKDCILLKTCRSELYPIATSNHTTKGKSNSSTYAEELAESHSQQLKDEENFFQELQKRRMPIPKDPVLKANYKNCNRKSFRQGYREAVSGEFYTVTLPGLRRENEKPHCQNLQEVNCCMAGYEHGMRVLMNRAFAEDDSPKPTSCRTEYFKGVTHGNLRGCQNQCVDCNEDQGCLPPRYHGCYSRGLAVALAKCNDERVRTYLKTFTQSIHDSEFEKYIYEGGSDLGWPGSESQKAE